MNRRFSVAWRLAAVLFSLVTCTALVLILSERIGTRFDLTASREHQLSAATREVLTNLQRPVTIAIAADVSALSKLTAQRLRDVLDAFAAADARLSVRLLDTSAPSGQKSYEALLRQMAAEDQPLIDEHIAALRIAGEEARDLAARALQAAEVCASLRDVLARSITENAGNADRSNASWDASAAELRLLADTLTRASAESTDQLSRTVDPLPVPSADTAKAALRAPLARIASDLTRLNDGVDQVALAASVVPEGKALARELGTRLAAIRDRAARLVSGLDKMGTLRVLKVAGSIGKARGCVLIAAPLGGVPQAVVPATSGSVDPALAAPTPPPSVTAVDIDELIGPDAASIASEGQIVVDRRARMEELLAAGLDAFVQRPRPLVVFVHADSGSLAPSFAPVRRLVERLALVSIDVAEWRVLADAAMPAPILAAKQQGRSVIFVTVSPVLIPGEQGPVAEQAAKVGKLSSAMDLLIAQRERMLISIVPSSLPSGGADDPLTKPLEKLGIKVDSGVVLMEQVKAAAGRGVLTDAVFNEAGLPIAAAGNMVSGADLITQSVRGLKTRFVWPVPVRIIADQDKLPDGVSAAPIISLPVSADRWAESEWLRVRQYRGDPARAPTPEFGGPRDLRSPSDGSSAWMLAVATESSKPTLQRTLVFGSQGWFADVMTDQATVIDGRAVPEFPGNGELFMSSVRWLAGQESMIRRSAEASSVPVIMPLSEGQQGGIRLLVIAVLPLSVLLLGVLIRALRG